MKKILNLVLLITCLTCMCCADKIEASPCSIEFTEYDKIYFEKDSLSEKLSTDVVDGTLRLKYGESKMVWFESEHDRFMILDSIEHEDMIKHIKENESNTN